MEDKYTIIICQDIFMIFGLIKNKFQNLIKIFYKIVLKDLFEKIKNAHTHTKTKEVIIILKLKISAYEKRGYFQWDFKLDENFKMQYLKKLKNFVTNI